MKERDPLGIRAILNHTRETHSQRPIDKDQFDEWLQHPVTVRLMQEIDCEFHGAAIRGEQISKEERHAAEMILNWSPRELREGGNDE